MDRLYGPSERRLSLLHDNFDPSCFHTPVSNIVKQQLVNTLTESWHGDEKGGGLYSQLPPLFSLTVVYPDISAALLLSETAFTTLIIKR